jgi:hypothetical protein
MQATQGWNGLDYAALLGQSESARGSRRASPEPAELRERYGGLSFPSTPVTTPTGPNPLRHLFSCDGMSTGPSSPRMLGEGVSTSAWPDVQAEQGPDRLSSADLMDAAAGIDYMLPSGLLADEEPSLGIWSNSQNML